MSPQANPDTRSWAKPHGDVLAMAWDRAERDDAHDLAGARLPETLTTTRGQMLLQGESAAAAFTQAVLLAVMFAFKPGRGL